MGVKPEDIERAIQSGNRVLAQLKRVCPRPGEPLYPEDARRRALAEIQITTGGIVKPTPKRIRQSSKPKSNKLESDYGNLLKAMFPSNEVLEQAVTFRLANGVRYTPDWVMLAEVDGLYCYEIKGRKSWDDSIVKLKVAASTYPKVHWYLCDKPDGSWREQEVLP